MNAKDKTDHRYKMYVWRTGLVEIGKETPHGAIEVGHGTEKHLKSWLVYCRLGKGIIEEFFCDGIPEAKTDKEAEAALAKFKHIIQNKMNGRKAFDGLKA